MKKVLNFLFWISLLFCIGITIFSFKATDFLPDQFKILTAIAYLIFIVLSIIRLNLNKEDH
ncbi:hypothetical protein J6TS2_43120 [Heyndrickxia sporothermodurans]|nr:hypothetical protein J6TS2_43120 [Heyndrickxia sporothermodurans]